MSAPIDTTEFAAVTHIRIHDPSGGGWITLATSDDYTRVLRVLETFSAAEVSGPHGPHNEEYHDEVSRPSRQS